MLDQTDRITRLHNLIDQVEKITGVTDWTKLARNSMYSDIEQSIDIWESHLIKLQNTKGKQSRNSEEFLEWLGSPSGGASTDRPYHVLEWAEKVLCDVNEDGAAFWRVVIEEWPSFDLIPHEEFAIQFERFIDYLPTHGIKEGLQLYRGACATHAPGMSWTTDRAVAERFSIGHRGKFNVHPVVYEYFAEPYEIAFRINTRNESEVVLTYPTIGNS